jgi:hypothetical protein
VDEVRTMIYGLSRDNAFTDIPSEVFSNNHVTACSMVNNSRDIGCRDSEESTRFLPV